MISMNELGPGASRDQSTGSPPHPSQITEANQIEAVDHVMGFFYGPATRTGGGGEMGCEWRSSFVWFFVFLVVVY